MATLQKQNEAKPTEKILHTLLWYTYVVMDKL